MTNTQKYKSLERFRLDEKVVVVTGGTGILGSLYCKRLSEAGAKVVIADLDKLKCQQLADEINALPGCFAIAMDVDLTNEQSVITWSQRIIEAFGVVDVLFNNAAAKSLNFFAPLDNFPLEDWNKVMAVNVTGMFLASRELGAFMAKQGKGSIINVSSVYGVVGPDQRIYEGSWYEEMGGPLILH